RDQLRGGRDQLRGGRDQLRGGRDQLRGGRDQLRGGRDQLRGGRDQLRGGRDQLRGGRDQFRGGRLYGRRPPRHSQPACVKGLGIGRGAPREAPRARALIGRADAPVAPWRKEARRGG